VLSLRVPGPRSAFFEEEEGGEDDGRLAECRTLTNRALIRRGHKKGSSGE